MIVIVTKLSADHLAWQKVWMIAFIKQVRKLSQARYDSDYIWFSAQSMFLNVVNV